MPKGAQDHQYDLEVKGQVNFQYGLWLVMRNPLSFFDGGCSY